MSWFRKKCFICKKRKAIKTADLCEICWDALRILHPGKEGHHE